MIHEVGPDSILQTHFGEMPSGNLLKVCLLGQRVGLSSTKLCLLLCSVKGQINIAFMASREYSNKQLRFPRDQRLKILFLLVLFPIGLSSTDISAYGELYYSS